MDFKGFTLVEIILAVIVLGFMVVFALPRMISSSEAVKVSEAVTVLSALYHSQKNYYLDHSAYTDDCTLLEYSVPLQNFNAPVCDTADPIVSVERTTGDYTITVTASGVFDCVVAGTFDCAQIKRYLPL